MDLAKLLLILNMGLLHPAADGTLDVYKDDKSPAVPIISAQTDHAWLLARRGLELGAIASSFFWSKSDPSAREVLLTTIGTILVRDAIFNFTYYGVRWGEPNRYGTYLVDFRLGFATLRVGKIYNGARVGELIVGVGFLVASEVLK